MGEDEKALAGASDSEWEIQEVQLNFMEKIASGAFGVLYRGSYCGQRGGHQGSQKREEELAGGGVQGVRSGAVDPAEGKTQEHAVQLIGAMTKPPRLCLVTGS